MQQSSKKEIGTFEKPDVFSKEYLLSLVEQHGIQNLVFMIPVRKYYEFGLIMMEHDAYSTLQFKITEERYKLDGYYKMQLVTTYPISLENTMEHKESYYVSDFVSMVRQGEVDVYSVNPEGGLTQEYVTLKDIEANVKPYFLEKVLGYLWPKLTQPHLFS